MCPHWGYVFKGTVTIAYDDGGEDVVGSGDAFYAPAGHTSWKADAGTELLQISPSKELAEVDAAIAEAMKGMQGGPAQSGDRVSLPRGGSARGPRRTGSTPQR
jgi:hypothetical protein